MLILLYKVMTEGISLDIYFFAGIGLLLLIISRMITQKRMLTITGILVMLLGFILNESIGILLAGSYIVFASFMAHRSYTHSLLGVVFYILILKYLYLECPITGIIAAGVAGYVNHLVADMKLLPMNRRGVKWFLPFWKQEF